MIKYNEYEDSQLPALQFLQKMGWQYVSPEDTIKERSNILSNVILEDILAKRLAAFLNPALRRRHGIALLSAQRGIDPWSLLRAPRAL